MKSPVNSDVSTGNVECLDDVITEDIPDHQEPVSAIFSDLLLADIDSGWWSVWRWRMRRSSVGVRHRQSKAGDERIEHKYRSTYRDQQYQNFDHIFADSNEILR